MSKENIVPFFNAAESNPDLQAKLAEIRRTAIQNIARETASLATEQGMPFSAEEFLESQNDHAEELTEKELGTVSGGWDPSGRGIPWGQRP